MAKQPLVSIGVPTYNRPEVLKKAISCLVKQSYTNLEIIISDNASEGNKTEKIVRLFSQKDKRVIYIKQEKNIGMINNFRFLLNKARGTYFMWLADDDTIDLNYIKVCVEFLKNNPDYSMAHGKTSYFLNNKLVFEERINLENETGFRRVFHFYRKRKEEGGFYGLTRREQMQKIYFTGVLAGDWLLMSEIAFTGKIKTLDSITNYRTNDYSCKTFKDFVRTLELKGIVEYFPNISISINVFNNIMKSSTYSSLNIISRFILASFCFIFVFKQFAIEGKPLKLYNKVRNRCKTVLKKIYN